MMLFYLGLIASLMLASKKNGVSVATTPDNVSSRLMIHIPRSLSKENGYEHREALFGVPPYGGSIAQHVYYADDTMCDPNVDTTKGFPSRDTGSNGKMKPWPNPFILMVDRGECTFVKKVRNAQRAGAAGVIIADNSCLCSDSACIAVNPHGQCESSEPIMADDGSGSDISIPSFLMFKHDADEVKKQLKDDHVVQMEMKWALPSPDDRVEYDLWTVPTDVISKDFLANFKEMAISLGKSAYFTPHMYVYDGVKSHCQNGEGSNMCYTLCTNNGRYCATDPDNDLENGISGADVVKESLRRICIWKHYGAEDGIGVEWWNYVNEFERLCHSVEFFRNEDCIKDAYKHSRVDGDKIYRCMSDSGGLEGDVQNSILTAEITAQARRGVVVLPTAFVNTAALRGALTPGNVFKAICAGFAAGTTPKACQSCMDCADPEACIKTGGSCSAYSGGGGGGSASGNGVSTHFFLSSMVLVVAIFSAIGVWYYQKTREDMRDQVRGILAEYMPLEGEEVGSPMDFASRGGGGASLIS